MACKQSEQCEHADICQYAKSNAYDILGGSCYRPKEPLTNEQWLKQCNTEQLAEELLAWWFDGANTYSQFGLYKWEIDGAKEKIVKWLKEIHE